MKKLIACLLILFAQSAIAKDTVELTPVAFADRLAAIERRYHDTSLQPRLREALSDPIRFFKTQHAWYVGAIHTPKWWFEYHDALNAAAHKDWNAFDTHLSAANVENC